MEARTPRSEGKTWNDILKRNDMRKRVSTTEQALICLPYLTDASREWLEGQGKPRKVMGKELPEDFSKLSIGDLYEIEEAAKKGPKEGLVVLGRVLLNLNEKEVLKAPCDAMWGLLNWATKEVERISALFQSIAIPPKADEVRAGADRLNFGVFGTLDWYALRMGITNHDEVARVPWLIIYQCQRNDNEKYLYQERLMNIKNNKK